MYRLYKVNHLSCPIEGSGLYLEPSTSIGSVNCAKQSHVSLSWKGHGRTVQDARPLQHTVRLVEPDPPLNEKPPNNQYDQHYSTNSPLLHMLCRQYMEPSPCCLIQVREHFTWHSRLFSTIKECSSVFIVKEVADQALWSIMALLCNFQRVWMTRCYYVFGGNFPQHKSQCHAAQETSSI